MRKKAAVTLWIVCVFAANCCTCGENANVTSTPPIVELARYEKQFSSVHVEPARMGSKLGVAVIFEGTDDLHYYARKETAPGGYKLEVEAKSDDFGFGEAVFPKPDFFQDSLGNSIEVYVGRFTVFIPLKTVRDTKNTTTNDEGNVEFKI